MLFSLIAVFSRWCFGDRRDDNIPTERPLKVTYIYTATWCWHVVCRGKVITTRLQKSLYESILHWEMIDPLGDILGVDGELLDSVVSWVSYRRAHKMIGSNRKHFITKWISGNMATGRGMKQRHQRLHDTCPLCDEPDEHLVHIMTVSIYARRCSLN